MLKRSQAIQKITPASPKMHHEMAYWLLFFQQLLVIWILSKMVGDVKQLTKEIKKRKIANWAEISLEEINLLLVKDYTSDPIQNHPMNFQSYL